jgi:hypothetical protein
MVDRQAATSIREAGPLPAWVRLGVLVLLALPQLVTGTWAVVATRDWYDSFPGVDPRLVAAQPPYNPHLAADAGAGFLATGIVLAVAAIWGRRSGVLIALLAYVAFSVPHTVYHWANPSPGLTGTEDVVNVAALVSGLVFAVVLGWGTLRTPAGRRVEDAA